MATFNGTSSLELRTKAIKEMEEWRTSVEEWIQQQNPNEPQRGFDDMIEECKRISVYIERLKEDLDF
tara:strand:+ start:47 stop:247 length:201 start_codon:yes stop_codon:yes gene_type:complete